MRPESFPVLDEAYETLAQYGDAIKIRVEGHTDNTGGRKLNERLSTDRARVVAEYIINKGIEKELVSYKGFAWDRPIAPNDTREGRQKNRRTEIFIEDRY